MKDNVIKRIALIKYLHKLGNEHAHKSEPLKSLSVLIYHDLVELFLDLICDELEINRSDSFMGYWGVINKKIRPNELSHKSTMGKLNKSRVNFKHHGIMPSASDIELYEVTTRDFLTENAQNFFSIDFSSISLSDLIQNNRIREIIKKAEVNYNNNEIRECQNNLARAFEYLLFDYEKDQKDYFENSPFDFGRELWSKPKIFNQKEDEERRFLESMYKSFERMKKYLRITSLGIDYKKYIRFKLNTPRAMFTSSDEVILGEPIKDNINQDEFEFCRDFLIETAITLQNFNIMISDGIFYDQIDI